MFEIGNSLREARVRRGIDFAQAELATKIRGKYLRALEDEHFELLPAETYVKGFLRTYAEYLGLDGQLYVDEYNSRFVIGEEQTRVARAPLGARGRSAATAGSRRTSCSSRSRRSPSSRSIVISAWKASGGKPPATPSHEAATVTARRAGAAADRHGAPRHDAPHCARRQRARRTSRSTGRSRRATLRSRFAGTRLWVQIDSPENLRMQVRGKLVHVPGRKPQVIIVTPTGWRPA